jgi:uncharacterized membrane protein YfcA
MEWYMYLLLVGAGILSGFINVFAGSGSTITLPLLMFLGLPANVANGTNRISILLQSIVAVKSFQNQQILSTKSAWGISIPAMIGSFIGAFLAIEINDDVMDKVIGAMLIMMFFVVLLKPEVWIKGRKEHLNPKPGIIQQIIFFFIGMYGGFIQAGVGFFLLAGLVLGAGLDIIKANAVKVFITLLFTIISLIVFIYSGNIDWIFGLVLGSGSIIGAFLASKYATRIGAEFIRYILLIIILLSSLQLFKFLF